MPDSFDDLTWGAHMKIANSIMSVILLGVAGFGLAVVPSHAAVILNVDGSGQLTGAQNVNVGGTLFDVAFADGTCIGLFSGCDSVSDFAFSDQGSAVSAAQALLTQVFPPGSPYDLDPTLTNGCEFSPFCDIVIPYDLFNANTDFSAAVARIVHPSNGSNETFLNSWPSDKDFSVRLKKS